MTVDFHVHVFPDKLAVGAVASLAERAHFTPYADGTLTGTKALLFGQGVDAFVALNIAVSPRTEGHVNDFAISLLKEDGVIPFGSVHPYSERALAELDRLCAAGVRGVKFHNEYQGVFVDDPKAVAVYKACAERGLVMLFHGGADRGFPPPVKAPPERMRRAVDAVPDGKFVVAHLGGQDMEEEAVRYLSGTPVMIDVSFAARSVGVREAEDCIRAFGAERVLFGSDCPWDTPADTLAFLRRMSFTEEELALIRAKNALRLLGLQ